LTAGPALFSLILPGSGHLMQQRKSKGYLFTAASGLLISGIIYYSYETESRRDDYMKQSGNADYNKLYNKYNQSYKIRNGMITGYSLFAIYVLYDLLNYPAGSTIQLSPALQSPYPALEFQIKW